MSESELYKDGGTITTMNINKQNAALANAYKAKMANEEKDNLYGIAREDGIREGSNSAYMDIMQRLSNSGQYTPIVEGSPEAYEMDANMARGANYGLLDEVENIIQPEYVPEQNQYINEAQRSKDSMMEDAQISAFMAAEAMGDTSEENMNNLLTAELDKRGL